MRDGVTSCRSKGFGGMLLMLLAELGGSGAAAWSVPIATTCCLQVLARDAAPFGRVLAIGFGLVWAGQRSTPARSACMALTCLACMHAVDEGGAYERAAAH